MGILDYDYREIKKVDLIAHEIMNLDKYMSSLSDEKLANKTLEFKNRLRAGETLDDILIEAFAVCREATYRVLNKKHYKVQLMGGIVIHQGRVAEMKTGEGKTLTELCPAYLNSLTSKGVHIITVNSYLAKRDKEEMQKLFEFLNISVGLVIEDTENRRLEYRKDIVYTTNSEVGFDYLKDNLVYDLRDRSLSALNYAIIDEIDSIFIDEARTPLIISSKGSSSNEIYTRINNIISEFKTDDYKIDYEDNTIFSTEKGIDKIEKALNLKTIASIENSEINHVITQSLRANFMLKKDKDYIVKDGEVILIDQNTGRISEGRRLSDGLHQCLEAKENVMIKNESDTLATITYQNLFKLYKKVSGMSGTVKSEENEFKEIYNLDIIVIPTNKEVKRIDHKDLIYKDKNSKYEAIISDILYTHSTGRPVLVGTLSIQDSEIISQKLQKMGIRHNLLNAKNHLKEANIIANAGDFGAITIATNMAGRGTDIKIKKQIDRIGGLRVIGSERAESIRIDNQLIGRAGRQGNNGSTQFYVSLEDELIVNNNKKDLKSKYDNVDSPKLRKEFEDTQKIVESKSSELRKKNAKYAELVDLHRKVIYKDRDLILFGKNIAQNISNMILELNSKVIGELFEKSFKTTISRGISRRKKEFFEELIKEMNDRYKFSFDEVYDYLYKMDKLDEIINYCTGEQINYINKLAEMGIINFKMHITKNFLIIIDRNWIKHIKAMELLKQRVQNEGYNQKNPLVVYNSEGYELYRDLLYSIKKEFIESLFNVILPELVRQYEQENISEI